MKKYLFLLLCLLIISACHKKTVPAISSRTNFPAPPRSAALPYDDKPESIAAGKIIFETKCGTCHELKDTRLYTHDRWNGLLKTMIPRAKLDAEQARQVTSYVMANAKK